MVAAVARVGYGYAANSDGIEVYYVRCPAGTGRDGRAAGDPTVDQLRAEITGREVKFAIVPGDGDVRSADPRVVLIKQLCTAMNVRTANGISFAAQLYDCLPY